MAPKIVRHNWEVTGPGYEIERQLCAGGSRVVAGVDEVGRGAWAGPVMVGAAVTDLSAPPAGLADSKTLSAARREAVAAELETWAAGLAYGSAWPGEIDELGMTEALRLASVRALEALPARPDVVIVDGKHDFLGAPWSVRCQVKADAVSVSVAAASVAAKVRRDALMAELGEDHPEFGFAGNAGYPAPVHRAALERLGPTPHHRMSWSYLDDLPRWRHLKRPRDPNVAAGQLTLGL